MKQTNQYVSLEDALRSVGSGWSDLITRVYSFIEQQKLTVGIVQVKEKWGGLRIYTDQLCDELDILIEKVEKESFHVCEECGASGTLRKKNEVYFTACGQHSNDSVIVESPWY